MPQWREAEDARQDQALWDLGRRHAAEMDLGSGRSWQSRHQLHGHCAFNIYVKDGIVWREEQQGEYGRSGDDTPDYGPRGCQKGNRQAKYMYGKQRVLYPMKRVGERGEGKWERISWDQAANEIADKFIDHATSRVARHRSRWPWARP